MRSLLSGIALVVAVIVATGWTAPAVMADESQQLCPSIELSDERHIPTPVVCQVMEEGDPISQGGPGTGDFSKSTSTSGKTGISGLKKAIGELKSKVLEIAKSIVSTLPAQQ